MFSLTQSEYQLKKKLGQGEGALNRPWHDAWAIAHARTVTCANQEKGGLGGQRKARPKVKLHGLTSPTPNSK